MRRIVGIHARTHPYEVTGCLNCKLLSVSIAPSAMPTRQDARFTATDELERNWNKDIPAYKRLVKEGLQPERVDGCAALESNAEHRSQIEGITPVAPLPIDHGVA